MKFVSHRGAAGLAPENSLASIKLAEKYKPLLIEIDVHQTSDGIFVIYHGALKRTYIGQRLDETFEELRSQNNKLLTLKDVLSLKTNTPFLLDIKIKSDSSTLIQLLRTSKRAGGFAFTSPHAQLLHELQTAFPKAETYISQPYYEGPYRPIELANMYNFTGININKWWVNPFTYHLCKQYKKTLFCYTVKRKLTMRVIRRFFPNICVVTDYPDRAASL